MTDEAQRSALADLVGAIAGLDMSVNWGDGQTSASDGQRFSLPRKVLQQTYSTKFSDFALEFYTFVADNYAPFYSTPIECTDRDAAFVLDGLLYNESDLELDEHYTDTHGYTEINLRCLRDARSAILPAHPGRAPPAHLPYRSQPRLRRSQKPGRACRPHHRPEFASGPLGRQRPIFASA